MKKLRKDNKGFTLVEMIVVLVILAILAAILVPALLGYIDEAKEKQYVLHGKSAYTAAQAVASKMYAKGLTKGDISKLKTSGNTDAAEIAKIAELSSLDCESLVIGFKETYKSSETDKQKIRNMYTIEYVEYKEAGVTVYLYNDEWTSVDPSYSGTKLTVYTKPATT